MISFSLLVTCCSIDQVLESIPYFLNLGCPFNLLWPIKSGKRDLSQFWACPWEFLLSLWRKPATIVRNLATWNYHAMTKAKLVSHVEDHLVENWGSQLSVKRDLRLLTPVKLCKLVSSHGTHWADSRDEPSSYALSKFPNQRIICK